MKSTSPRRALLAALALAPVLAACGFNAQTDQVYQAAEGVNNRDSRVDVLNALVVSGANGSGTLIANLVNNDVETADELSGVTGSGVTATVTKGADTAIPANGALNLATDGAIAIKGSTVQAGGFVELTFSFANADSATLRVPVVRADGDYADVPLPSEKPSDSASETPGDGAETPSDEPTANGE